jgi:hypothetical protein
MINSTSLRSDPNILPSLSPFSRKDIGDCGVTYNTQRAEIVDFGLTRMLPKNGVVLIHMRVLEEGLGLFAINQGKAGIKTLPDRIRSRPISPKGEGWKKQKDRQVSHNTRSLSGNTRIVK